MTRVLFNRKKTKEEAVTASTDSPNTIFFPTDADGIILGGKEFGNVPHYGVCSTAAATTAKVVTITDFRLVTGAVVFVKFSATNSAASPTLNVSGTGAKAMYMHGRRITAQDIQANMYYEFLFDGSYYQMISNKALIPYTSNTSYSSTSYLSNLVTGITVSKLHKCGYDRLMGMYRLRIKMNISTSVAKGIYGIYNATDGVVATFFANGTYTSNFLIDFSLTKDLSASNTITVRQLMEIS